LRSHTDARHANTTTLHPRTAVQRTGRTCTCTSNAREQATESAVALCTAVPWSQAQCGAGTVGEWQRQWEPGSVQAMAMAMAMDHQPCPATLISSEVTSSASSSMLLLPRFVVGYFHLPVSRKLPPSPFRPQSWCGVPSLPGLHTGRFSSLCLSFCTDSPLIASTVQ
jgi:hypothetical protein